VSGPLREGRAARVTVGGNSRGRAGGESRTAWDASKGADPAQLNINSELKRTRGIRLFNKNIALRWRPRVLTQCDFCPVL